MDYYEIIVTPDAETDLTELGIYFAVSCLYRKLLLRISVTSAKR